MAMQFSGQHTLYGPVAFLCWGFCAPVSRYFLSSFSIPQSPIELMGGLEWWLFPRALLPNLHLSLSGMMVLVPCLTTMTILLWPRQILWILNSSHVIYFSPNSLNAFTDLFIMVACRQRTLSCCQAFSVILLYTTSQCRHSCWVPGICWLSVQTLRI